MLFVICTTPAAVAFVLYNNSNLEDDIGYQVAICLSISTFLGDIALVLHLFVYTFEKLFEAFGIVLGKSAFVKHDICFSGLSGCVQ